MYNIATLNKISPIGLSKFGDNYNISDNLDTAQGIMVRSQSMHEMNFADSLLAISRAGAGVNNIPLERCANEGIVVFNTPGANANSVKELVIAGIILAARNIPAGINWASSLTEDVSKQVEKGKSQFAGSEIKGKTLGVVGLGAIGVLVANAAQSLGMKVIGYDPFISLKSAHNLSNTIPVTNDLSQLLPMCDYVTLHIPATDKTTGMFNVQKFAELKDNAVLLNFSRDKLINEEALLGALDDRLKYYVTDFPTDKLIGHDKIILLPHLGASTKEAEDNCATMAAEELIEYIEKGNITNSVNFPACSLGELHPEAEARVCILNKNVPSMLGKITGILSDLNVNIRNLTNKSKGDFAVTLMDIDADVSEEEFRKSLDIDGIIKIRIIK